MQNIAYFNLTLLLHAKEKRDGRKMEILGIEPKTFSSC